MARVFATLDRTALGPELELEQGGLVVACKRDAMSINRLVRATMAVAKAGRGYFEAAFYGDGVLVDRASVGIVTGTHNLEQYVGQGVGYGFKVGNGGIYSNGALIAEAGSATKRRYIGVLVDLDDLSCSWFVDGNLLHRQVIDNRAWYPAISVSGVVAYDLRCYINFGQYQFVYPQSVSGKPVDGWFADTDVPAPLYLCPRNSAGFTSQRTDSPASTTFLPRIANADALSVSSKSTIWPWGSSNTGSSYGELEIDNADGVFDELAGQDLRDQIARIVVATPGGSYDTANAAFTAVVDDVKCIGESKLRVSFKDLQSTLERPLQRRIFPPWADVGVAFRPLPITLGACRNVVPMLEDQVELRYRLHDAPITNIAAVRDKGTLLDPHSTPPQYVPTNDLQGLLLKSPPVGLLTADVSSEGTQISIPGVPDVLQGGGDFFAGVIPQPAEGSLPEGWTTGGGTEAPVRWYKIPGTTKWAASLSTRTVYNPEPHDPRYGKYLQTGPILQPGKTYRIYFKLYQVNGGGQSGITPYGLMVRSDLGRDATGAITPHMQALGQPSPANGYSTFVYTVPPGAVRPLYFIVTTAHVGGVTTGSNEWTYARFHDVKVELLGQVEQALPLTGISLEQYWTEIFRRANVPDSAWVREDCRTIDSAIGNKKIGVHIREPISVLQALRLPLDTFGATMFTDAQGKFRVRRMVDPSLVADNKIASRFSASDIPRGVTPRTDLAPGLTTTAGARRNWQSFNDSDFVTDYLLVPAATRTQFKRKNQFVRSAPASLMPTYRFASSAAEFDSLFDSADDAQNEILRMVEPYLVDKPVSPLGKARIPTLPRFIDFTVHYDTASPPRLDFGDVIIVTYPRHRLKNGQRLAVVGTTINPYTKTMQIVAWGTA